MEKKIEYPLVKKREHALVKMSYDLASIPLQGFAPREIDFFLALMYLFQNQKETKRKIYFSELRGLIGYTRRGDMKLIEELKMMSYHFSQIVLMETRNAGFKIIVPFTDFEVIKKEKAFIVGIHPDFLAAINDLDGSPGKRYTIADVVSISLLKSTYAKNCLRMLFLYRKTGYWYPSVDELRYYLDIPENYRTSDITRRVLDQIKKEFEEANIFESFDVDVRYDERNPTKGRRKTIGYVFAFKFKENIFVAEPAESAPHITCPLCGKPLILIRRRDGSGSFFGHKDGWKRDAECSYTVNAIEVQGVEVETKDKGVSVGELEAYYRSIREAEVKAQTERKKYIKENEPDIWELVDENERGWAEFFQKNAGLTISEETRKSRKQVQEYLNNQKLEIQEELKKKGYAEDYLSRRYRCKACQDSGQLPDGRFCDCRKQRIEEAKEWIKRGRR